MAKRTKAMYGIFSALAVITLVIGLWSINSGKFTSSAQVTTCELSGKISGYSCNTRSARFKAQDQSGYPVSGLTSQVYGLLSPLSYKYSGFSNAGSTGTNIYRIMAYSDCNGTYSVTRKTSSGSSYTQTWQKGRCESNWSGNISIPQYQYSMSGPQLDLANNKVAYFAVKTVQNTCPPTGGTNCVHPVSAQVCNPSRNTCAYSSAYDGIIRVDLPPGSWNVSAKGVNNKIGNLTINSDGCNGSAQTIQIPKAY